MIFQSIYTRRELLVRQRQVHHVRPPRRVIDFATVSAAVDSLAVWHVRKEVVLEVRDL